MCWWEVMRCRAQSCRCMADKLQRGACCPVEQSVLREDACIVLQGFGAAGVTERPFIPLLNQPTTNLIYPDRTRP